MILFEQTLTVDVIGDTSVELNERFKVVLSQPTNGAILKGTGFGDIANDDGVSILSVQDISANENDATATFTVTLSPAVGYQVTAQYTTNDVRTFLVFLLSIYLSIYLSIIGLLIRIPTRFF